VIDTSSISKVRTLPSLQNPAENKSFVRLLQQPPTQYFAVGLKARSK
jgi:hypothetical protein